MTLATAVCCDGRGRDCCLRHWLAHRHRRLLLPAAAQQARRDRQRRHRRRGDGTERAGGRRLGDRRDHRPADPLHQERRHRRPGPLPHPRSAEGELRGVGARLRPRRHRQGPQASRAGSSTSPRAAPTPEGRGRNLSGDLLVLDAEDAGASTSSRSATSRRQARVAQRHQDQRLLRLPRARQQGDAHHPADVRRHEVGGCLGAPHPVRPGHDQHGDRRSAASTPSARSSCSRTGPTASPPANCRPRSRRDRRAASATSSSRSGTFPIPSTTCTTSPRPTSASRRSTPTA